MHPRKNLVLVIVVVVLLVASGIILYRGLVHKSATTAAVPIPQPPVAAAPTAGSEQQPTVAVPGAGIPAASAPVAVTGLDNTRILPFGNRFDLSLLKRYNPDAKLYAYPKVAPEEIGPTLSNLLGTGTESQ